MAQALADFRAIADYYRDEAPLVENRITTTIYDRVGSLAEYPWLGKQGTLRDTRELVILQTPFVVTYRVKLEVVEILRVRHGAQNRTTL